MSVEVEANIPQQALSREELAVNEKVSNEEYKVWKKAAPIIYDNLVIEALKWPTLTVEWLPGKKPGSQPEFDKYSLLLGTHTSKMDTEYVQIAEVNLPNEKFTKDTSFKNIKEIKIKQKIRHEGEVNKARYSPLNPNKIATTAVNGEVLIFDRDNVHSAEEFKPLLRLQHHTKDTYGLSWNSNVQQQLVTGSDDTTVALWDLTRASGGIVTPQAVLKDHNAIITDVQFSYKIKTVFGSVSEDTTALIHDTRELSAPVLSLADGHSSSINSIAFNPFNELVVATGSSDTTVAIWDLRNSKAPVVSLNGHAGDITSVRWSPHDESVLASAACDRRLNVWDLSLVTSEQTAEEAAEGPPELIFIHAGHTNKISDFSWHPTMPWTLATASEDNVLQVWQIATVISDRFQERDEPEEEEEGEEVEEEKSEESK